VEADVIPVVKTEVKAEVSAMGAKVRAEVRAEVRGLREVMSRSESRF
jgi:hypothetical protein